MMSIKDEPILVFEYFTASGENDKCISSEAEALIYALLDDLVDFNVTVILNNTYSYIADKYENVESIIIDENLENYLKNNLNGFNHAIYIAAENDNHLYNIAKILEDKNINFYNSSSNACLNCSDKYLLFKHLEGIVNQPLSYKLTIDDNWKNEVKKIYKKWQKTTSDKLKLIIKPINGVDCEDIVIVEDIDNLEDVFTIGSELLVQKYIEGEDVSVSLIVFNQKAMPISINKQFIEIKSNHERYLGGMLPYKTEFSKEILTLAIKACEAMDGLNGFVGVDLRVNPKEVSLIEINSRFTTPYVGLQKIANFNIAKTIINLQNNEITIDDCDISIKGNIEFRKENNNLIIKEF